MALNYLTFRSSFLPLVLRHPFNLLANLQHSTHFRHCLSSSFIRPLSYSSSLKFFSSGSYAKDSTAHDTENESTKVGSEAAQSPSVRRTGNARSFVTPDIIQKLQKDEEKRVREWRERNELLKRQVPSQKQTPPSSSPTTSTSDVSEPQKEEIKKKRKLINRIFRIPDNESWRTPKHAWKIGMTFILFASSLNFVLFVLIQGEYYFQLFYASLLFTLFEFEKIIYLFRLSLPYRPRTSR